MTSVLETGAVFNQMFHALVSVPYLALSKRSVGGVLRAASPSSRMPRAVPVLTTTYNPLSLSFFIILLLFQG